MDENKELTEQELAEIEDYLWSKDSPFYADFARDDFFEDEWDEALEAAANSAEIEPGYPAKIANDPLDSYEGADPELVDYEGDYDKINTELFAKWVDAIAQDPDVPDVIKQNIHAPEVQESLKDLYNDWVVPFDQEGFEERLMEIANEIEPYEPDYDYDDDF